MYSCWFYLISVSYVYILGSVRAGSCQCTSCAQHPNCHVIWYIMGVSITIVTVWLVYSASALSYATIHFYSELCKLHTYLHTYVCIYVVIGTAR